MIADHPVWPGLGADLENRKFGPLFVPQFHYTERLVDLVNVCRQFSQKCTFLVQELIPSQCATYLVVVGATLFSTPHISLPPLPSGNAYK